MTETDADYSDEYGSVWSDYGSWASDAMAGKSGDAY